MKKVLFCATIDGHFKSFHLPYIKWFKEQGWEVHIASYGNSSLPYVDRKYNLSIQRSPFNFKNVGAYRELKSIIDSNNYSLIHCHTPMGGVLARLAARGARKKGTKVIYTAHGFHFFKGAPFLNWLIYYPIEKTLAKYTDCLITINQEDYTLAKRKLKACRVEHVHGVGVDIDQFRPKTIEEKLDMKISFGCKPGDFLMFYAAEFNKNKNQQLLINVLANIKGDIPNAKLLLAGDGPLLEYCKELANKKDVAHLIHFLGYRDDLYDILPMCDITVASSLREGLPVNIMESMACGLPVVASKNRGHNELVSQLNCGWTVANEEINEMGRKIKELYFNQELVKYFGLNARYNIETTYSINKVLMELCTIYISYMNEKEELKWAVH